MARKAGRLSRMPGFLAVVRYELLWNIRKKKFLAILILAFGLASLTLFLPVVLNNANNLPTEPNPNYVITTGTGVGSFGFFLFALVTVMNSISGEFESGSIVPLLTKPISRTTVYVGKLFAAVVTAVGSLRLAHNLYGGRRLRHIWSTEQRVPDNRDSFGKHPEHVGVDVDRVGSWFGFKEFNVDRPVGNRHLFRAHDCLRRAFVFLKSGLGSHVRARQRGSGGLGQPYR